ncbi:glutaredoxin 3 [Legionella sp. D16C41]|uniref:glutaredoxin 3 n=1 Tax=Legionella sp. D16C41 TaxID=3402688 RepID=UPI003AF4CCE9
MANVIIYTTEYCPYCRRAKQLLDSKNVSYKEIRVDEEPGKREEMMAKSGRRTVPQIFINDQAIGGCDDLHALESQGRLDQLLKD